MAAEKITLKSLNEKVESLNDKFITVEEADKLLDKIIALENNIKILSDKYTFIEKSLGTVANKMLEHNQSILMLQEDTKNPGKFNTLNSLINDISEVIKKVQN